MTKTITVGLTGQTGSGKSTVSLVYKNEGLYVIDCDELYRKLTVNGSECCKALKEQFPVCFKGLELDRKKLADIVFNDKYSLDILNKTVFPFIIAEIRSRIISAKKEGYKIVVLDAPTLFESEADKLCDLIVSCISDEEYRLRRIMTRDGLTEEQAKARMSSQLCEDHFRTNSDIVIDNNSSLKALQNASLLSASIIKGKVYGR